MNKLIPENNTVLCVEDTPNKIFVVEFGVKYERENFPTYRVVRKSSDYSGLDISENDIIICNSTGTKLMDNGKTYFLFKSENVAGKII